MRIEWKSKIALPPTYSPSCRPAVPARDGVCMTRREGEAGIAEPACRTDPWALLSYQAAEAAQGWLQFR